MAAAEVNRADCFKKVTLKLDKDLICQEPEPDGGEVAARNRAMTYLRDYPNDNVKCEGTCNTGNCRATIDTTEANKIVKPFWFPAIPPKQPSPKQPPVERWSYRILGNVEITVICDCVAVLTEKGGIEDGWRWPDAENKESKCYAKKAVSWPDGDRQSGFDGEVPAIESVMVEIKKQLAKHVDCGTVGCDDTAKCRPTVDYDTMRGIIHVFTYQPRKEPESDETVRYGWRIDPGTTLEVVCTCLDDYGF